MRNSQLNSVARWFVALLFILVGCAGPVQGPAGAPVEPTVETSTVEIAPIEASATATPATEATPWLVEAPGTSDAEEPVPLVVAVADTIEDPRWLDPIQARPENQSSSMLLRALYQTLVVYDPAAPMTVVPDLATSWEISEDGLNVTFTLQEGIRAANGNSITSEDVVYSIERLRQNESPLTYLAESIASVEAVDDLTVIMTLAYPDSTIVTKLAASAFSILERDVVEANVDDPLLWASQAGSGPYVIERWEPGNSVTLASNPAYPDAPRGFDPLTMLYIPEHERQAQLLQTGEVDVAMNLPIESITMFQDDITIQTEPTFDLVFLEANQNNEILRNARVLEAFRYAVDYDLIREQLGDERVGGRTVTPPSFIPLGFEEAQGEGIPYDTERANALLDEAGYLFNQDGERFALSLTYPGFDRSIEFTLIARIIQENLAAVGVRVELQGVNAEQYLNSDHELRLSVLSPSYLNANQYLEFLPGGTIARRNNWDVPELADLRDQAKLTNDSGERQELFDRAQAQLNQDGIYTFVAQSGAVFGYRADKVNKFAYSPVYRYWNPCKNVSCDACASIDVASCPWRCKWCCGGC